MNLYSLQHPRGEDLDEHCRKLVRSFGNRVLKHTVPYPFGGHKKRLGVRSLCLIREFLAYHSGLADFAFAMQGLGSGPISLAGSGALQVITFETWGGRLRLERMSWLMGVSWTSTGIVTCATPRRAKAVRQGLCEKHFDEAYKAPAPGAPAAAAAAPEPAAPAPSA